jgi:lipoate-protein ligase A
MTKDTQKPGAKAKRGLSLTEVARNVLTEAAGLGPKVAYSEPPQKLNPTDGPARGSIQDLSHDNNERATGPSASAGAATQKLSPNSDQGAVDDLGDSATSNDEKTPAAKAVRGGRTDKVPGGNYPAQEKYNPDNKKIFAEDDILEDDEYVAEADDEDDDDDKDNLKKMDKDAEDDDDDGDHDEPDGDECKKEDLVPEDVIDQGIAEANIPQHMAALFSGNAADLSEDFKEKALTIFEAAVRDVSVSMFETLREHYDVALNEAVEVYRDSLSEQIDDYLGYVVEQWVAENEVAIESGLRAELTEDFISGLRNLFVENYIDIPAEKVDVVESLNERITELEERLNEEFETNVSLRRELSEAIKVEIFNEATRGLSDVQVEKLRGLTEGITTSDVNEYAEKVLTLKESYLTTGSKSSATSGDKTLDVIEPSVVKDGKTGQVLSEEGGAPERTPRMAAYVNSLSRQVNSPTYKK